MSERRKETVIELFPRQKEFVDAVLSGDYRYLLYGGAIRGGKTVLVLALLFILCRVYKGSRWAVVRKDLPTLKRNTIPSFEAIRPTSFVGQINKSEWTAKCTNGSEIIFFPESLKDDPEHNRWKGLEVNGFALEEMNELAEGSFNKAIERAGSWKATGGVQPPPLVLGTCNPAKGYVKRTFYDPWKRGALSAPFFYLPARIYDNPHIDKAYLESLETLRITDPVAYKRFVEGDWETGEDPTQLIKFEWLENAQRNVEPMSGKRRLGVDVARFGDDDTVLVHIEGNRLWKIDRHHGLSTDRTADIVQAVVMHPEYPVAANETKVDGVGLGAGVVDSLRRNHVYVVDVISGAKAEERKDSLFKFNNLRSQMWWDLRESLRKGEVCIDVHDPRLIDDLAAPRYSISGDKVISVESKEEIKRRLGRSPDAGDAFVYGWARVHVGEYEYTPAKGSRRSMAGLDAEGSFRASKGGIW